MQEYHLQLLVLPLPLESVAAARLYCQNYANLKLVWREKMFSQNDELERVRMSLEGVTAPRKPLLSSFRLLFQLIRVHSAMRRKYFSFHSSLSLSCCCQRQWQHYSASKKGLNEETNDVYICISNTGKLFPCFFMLCSVPEAACRHGSEAAQCNASQKKKIMWNMMMMGGEAWQQQMIED